jgi:hypothetical protein
MNANEKTSNAGARPNRIKIVSRIVKYAILALFVFSIGIFLLVSFPTWTLATLKSHPVWFGLVSLPQIVLWVWYWKLARLFDYYERGLIFTSKTIRCIKTLGILCVLDWMLINIRYFISDHHSMPNPSVAAAPHIFVGALTPLESFRAGFFSFSIGPINFGLLLAGVIIVIIAWIMDEGRKIQEEQELTV